MPTNRTRRSRAPRSLDYWKLTQLVAGNQYLIAGPGLGYFPKGASSGCGHWSETEWADWREQVAADWQIYGPDILAWWRGETEQFTAIYASIGNKQRNPSAIPWAAREFREEK